MNKKTIILLISLGIIIMLILATAIIFKPKEAVNESKDNDSVNSTAEDVNEIQFSVVRVLPSGFSPSEVTLTKGSIIRFTNPTDEAVTIIWEGDKQYSSGTVVNGNDMATEVFDTVGTYTFSKESEQSHRGKVVVE